MKTLERNREWDKQNPERRKVYTKLQNDKNTAAGKGRNGRQKPYRLKSRYGITIEQYEQMAAEQSNVCAICGKTSRGNGRGIKRGTLAVDHCHKTGKVRGLLCAVCNTFLGRIDDKPEIARRAAIYLEAAQSQSVLAVA